MIMKILGLEKEEYLLGHEVPPSRLDARILDVLRELGEDERRVGRGWRECLRLTDRLIRLAPREVELIRHYAIQLLPRLEKRFRDV